MAIQYIGNTISGLAGDTKPTPSANEKGVIFIETDTNKIYQWDTDSWNEIVLSDASTSAKGIASFSSDNFAASSGAITIKDAGVILGTETTGNYVATVAGTTNEIDVSGSTGAVTIGIPSNPTLTGNAIITGNLTVQGDTITLGDATAVNATVLTVDDPTIALADNNTGNAVDIGFYGKYVSSGTKYAGLVRDATDNSWYLFNTSGSNDEPTTTLNVSGIGLADLRVGNLYGTIATAAQGSITSVSALTGGSIASGFGTISTGNTITTTAKITGGELDIDDVIINGATIGHTDDTDLITLANGIATVAGEVSMTTLDIGGTNVSATAAEINLIDGDTARGTTAVASGDGILINDAGTMRMTNVDTVSTYFASHNVGGGNIVTTGALNSGSITSGFGNIDIGSSNLTATGTITTGLSTLRAIVTNGASQLAVSGTTSAELGVLMGSTSATSTTLADADRVVVNDNGTMVQVALTDFETYFESALDTLSNVTSLGTLTTLGVGNAPVTGYTAVVYNDSGNNQVRMSGDAASKYTLFAYRNLGSGSTATPVVYFNNDEAGDDQPTLRVNNDGTGDIVQLYEDGAEVWSIASGGDVDMNSNSLLNVGSASGDWTNTRLNTGGQFLNVGSQTPQDRIAIDLRPTTTGENPYGFYLAPAITHSGTGTSMYPISLGGGATTTADDSITYSLIPTVYINEPFITKGSSDTITEAVSLYIPTAPTEGTNNYALHVDAGDVRLDGKATIGDTAIPTSDNYRLTLHHLDAHCYLSFQHDSSPNYGVTGTDIGVLSSGIFAIAQRESQSVRVDIAGSTKLIVNADGSTTFNGVVDITDTTDSSDDSGDTGALRVEGGASIAKKLYVGTDLDVDGTANLDAVDIDGAVDMASTLTGGGGDLIWDTDTLVVDVSADSVGIGTTAPVSELEIFSKTYQTAPTLTMTLSENAIVNNHVLANIDFRGTDTDASGNTGQSVARVGARIKAVADETWGTDADDNPSRLEFMTQTDGNTNALTTRMTINRDGKTTVAGIVDITDTTDSSDNSGDTGALRVEGGASIAKKLYVGTDLDVDGTAELDNITIGGAQGSDGQVLTSTGSAVAWEDAAGGGGGVELCGLDDDEGSTTSTSGAMIAEAGSTSAGAGTAIAEVQPFEVVAAVRRPNNYRTASYGVALYYQGGTGNNAITPAPGNNTNVAAGGVYRAWIPPRSANHRGGFAQTITMEGGGNSLYHGAYQQTAADQLYTGEVTRVQLIGKSSWSDMSVYGGPMYVYKYAITT